MIWRRRLFLALVLLVAGGGIPLSRAVQHVRAAQAAPAATLPAAAAMASRPAPGQPAAALAATRGSRPESGTTPGPAAPAPNLQIEAKAAAVMEYATGELLFEKDASERLPLASVTKVMTFGLFLEALHEGRMKLTDMVEASAHACSMGGTQIWLEPGERMSVKDLLYAVAVGSANDAAVALAEHLEGSEDAFVAKMNEKAKELGLSNTHFVNVTGLPAPDHYSSARDIAVMSRWALGIPDFTHYTSTWDYYVRKGSEDEVWLTTFNKLLKAYPGYDGIKTGFTNEAGYCLASTAKRGGLRIIAVVLGEPTPKARNKDVIALLNYGFGQFRAEKVAHSGEQVALVNVQKGRAQRVPGVLAEELYGTFRRGAQPNWRKEAIIPQRVVAPVQKGQVLGKYVIWDGQRKVAETKIIAAAAVERGSLLDLIKQVTRQIFASLFKLPW